MKQFFETVGNVLNKIKTFVGTESFFNDAYRVLDILGNVFKGIAEVLK